MYCCPPGHTVKILNIGAFYKLINKKAAEVLEDDHTGGEAFAFLLRPHPGVFRQPTCVSTPWNLPFFFKNCNIRGLTPGVGGWALLELTYALRCKKFIMR